MNFFFFSPQIPGQLYGLEKFWAFMKYYKNSEQLDISDKLQGYLNQFKTIEDFRVEEPELNEMLQGSKQQQQQQPATKKRHRSLSENETTAQNADAATVVAAAPTASSSVRDV